MQMFQKKNTVFVAMLVFAVLNGMLAPPTPADVLVTREGDRLETEGPWEVRKNLVVFTTPEGVLSSIRLSEIDVGASELATKAPFVDATEEGDEDAKPLLVLTNVEIPSAEEAAAARGEVESAGDEEEAAEKEPADPCLPSLTLGNPVLSGKKVVFNGAVLSPQGCPGIVGIHWFWGDGTESDGWFPAKHNYDQPGEYYLEIVARNQQGKTMTYEVVVKIPADGSGVE